MITVKLSGGLGNQLFQYAFGRRSAIAAQTKLALDLSHFETTPRETPRSFALQSFALPQDVLLVTEPCQPLPLWYERWLPLSRRSYLKQDVLGFEERWLNLGSHTYLDGYWQSPLFFRDVQGVIRHDFQLNNLPTKRNKQLLQKIEATTAVSVHVRRADYVTDKVTNDYHGVLDYDYYFAAVGEVMRRVKKPELFVFSDDIPWARTHFTFDCPMTFVDHNAHEPHEDLRLMSRCKHHIIANSTFSWWGAWLADYTFQMVVAPRQWFKGDSRQLRQTLYLPDWIQV